MIKFKNVPRVDVDARWIEMPYGKFLCTWYDTRSADFAKAQLKHSKPYQVQLRNQNLDSDIDRRISVGLFIEISLKDWKDVLDDADQPIPYTVANATELFVGSPRAFYDVVDEAMSILNFKVTEADRKNS